MTDHDTECKALTLKIRQVRLNIYILTESGGDVEQLRQELAELEKMRARAYTRRYISRAGKRERMNELSRQYYHNNKEEIAQKNKARYEITPRVRKRRTESD